MQSLHVSKKKKQIREHLMKLCCTCYKAAYDSNEQTGKQHEKYGIKQEEEGQFRQKEAQNQKFTRNVRRRCLKTKDQTSLAETEFRVTEKNKEKNV